MGEKFCPVCKNKNASDAATCAYCGSVFESTRQMPVNADSAEAIQPELILKRSEHLQHLAEYPVDALILYVMAEEQPLVVPGLRTVVLGRLVNAMTPGLVDLSPYGAADLGVSRQHAQIGFSGTYTLTDLGSTNGTWLNQARLTAHKPYALHSGDDMRLGSLRLNVYHHQDTAGGNGPEEVISLTQTLSASAQRPRLTMAYWADVLQPYLAALVEVQAAIDEFQGLQPRAVSINAVSAVRPELPIGLSLSGVSQAVLLVKNFVVPWRSDNAADLSLHLTGRALAPAAVSSPVAANTHPAATTVLEPAEASPAARQAASENLRAKLPGLAQAAAEHLAVLLAANQKGLADRLLPPLSVLATSRLQVVLDKLTVGS